MGYGVTLRNFLSRAHKFLDKESVKDSYIGDSVLRASCTEVIIMGGVMHDAR